MKKVQRAGVERKAITYLCMVLISLLLTSMICMGASGEAVQTDLEDGEYSIEVKMEGGSGRAQIVTPAVLIVRDGYAYAQIQWHSSSYDYMKVENEKYLPINEEGNSTFEIPITVFGEPMTVIGDTTAMSVPHEVEYTLTFDENSISSGGGKVSAGKMLPGVVIGIVAIGIAIVQIKRKNGKKNE